RGRRSCGPPSRGRWSRSATTSGSCASRRRRSSPRCALSAAPARTAPSCSNGSSLLTSSPAAHDVLVGSLVLLAGAVTQGGHAPRGHRVTTGGRRALATAVGVVGRVHRGPAGLRAHAHVPLASRLADLDVLVVGVADGADRRAA